MPGSKEGVSVSEVPAGARISGNDVYDATGAKIGVMKGKDFVPDKSAMDAAGETSINSNVGQVAEGEVAGKTLQQGYVRATTIDGNPAVGSAPEAVVDYSGFLQGIGLTVGAVAVAALAAYLYYGGRGPQKIEIP